MDQKLKSVLTEEYWVTMSQLFTQVGAAEGFEDKRQTTNKIANDLIVVLMPFVLLSNKNKKCHLLII